MQYSTKRKQRSRLLGHRKRRRIPGAEACRPTEKIDWLEYKTLRQYQSLGEVLDGVRAYGFDGVKVLDYAMDVTGRNGHKWITEDQDI